MKKTIRLLILVGILSVAGAVIAQSGGGYDLSWTTIDSGGGKSNGGSYALQGTIGQYDAGQMSGGNFTMNSGYWHPACTTPQASGAKSGANIIFTWSNNSQNIYRASNAPYATNGTEIGNNVSSGWAYAEPLLGNATQNAYYVVGISANCGDHIGEFDFAITPGS